MMPFFDWLYHHYSRVKTDGWENIPAIGRMLLVDSHNGGLAAPDSVMMTYDWLRRFGAECPAYAHDDDYVNSCYEQVRGIMQKELDSLFTCYE